LELAIGATVSVVNNGEVYTSAEAMSKDMKLTRWKKRMWPEDTNVRKGDVGIVMAIRSLGSRKAVGVYFAVHDEEHILASSGVSVVQDPPRSCPSAPVAIMKSLWESRPDSCDICVTASGGEAVRTHASVLVGASPVFAAMLSSGMKETSAKEIKLPDTGADVVESVLQLLYLGTLPSAVNHIEVLRFAHKYSLVEAVKPIADELVAAMHVDNACDMWRMLRDFDKQGTSFVDKVLKAWRDDEAMMKVLLTGL